MSHESYKLRAALNRFFCADVPLRNYSLTHSLAGFDSV